ncbi:MAG: PAS domain-containing sensor histidine kinase [Rhizobiales bacterium]|nr:PAS domain-containing sensor histidine kinase [Hyphomicrobiales bacterium]
MSDVPAGLLAACDRLVHPRVGAAAEREHQSRLIAVLLAAPFATGIALAFAPVPGVGLLLAVPSAVAAVAWALALAVSLRGSRVEAERIALAFAVAGVATAIAYFGPASPLALMSAALGFEACWIGRSRKAALAGIGAALAALGLGIALAVGTDAGGAWQWLPPLLYAGFSWPRLRGLMSETEATIPGAAAAEEPFAQALLALAPSGEIVSATQAAADALGLPVELLNGSALLDRVHVADRVAFLAASGGALRHGERRACEMRLRVAEQGRASSYRLFEAEFAPASRGEARVLLRDASALAALRDALAEAKAAADSTDVAKSRFLAAVSHELRTPLNSIIGFSDMLIHGIAGPLADERQREYVDLIRQSGGHLLSVVNAILDVSKIEAGAYGIRPEPFAVGEAVELCRSMTHQQALENGLGLIAEVAPGTGEICADRRAVQQIIINLLSNAIKFTPRGGRIVLDARRRGAWLRISVADTGIGIAEDDLQRIGEPFTQVRNDFTRQFDGAGLGLSLVKGLVRLHEGEMTIESAPGEGTTVTVLLPVAGPKGEPAQDGGPAARTLGLPKIETGGFDEKIRKSA